MTPKGGVKRSIIPVNFQLTKDIMEIPTVPEIKALNPSDTLAVMDFDTILASLDNLEIKSPTFWVSRGMDIEMEDVIRSNKRAIINGVRSGRASFRSLRRSLVVLEDLVVVVLGGGLAVEEVL
ncbi:hypothetical protein WICPIJ_001344 [Wickerhamomyces pijperi]|uniref:Uncharacterized protein n=1 Tax=Wickerhamomyces pijperi TaxID=599730 RepID=A0A9P8QDV7_WICPI|nr:hypothetical protein WICPIJ_001344 [Wickerhamomyces pijperi]